MSKEVYEHYLDIKFHIPNRKISFKPYAFISLIKTCNYFTDFIPKYELTVKFRDKHLDILRLYDKEISVFIRDILFYGESSRDKSNSKILSEQEFACYYDKNTLPNYMAVAKSVNPDINDPTVTYIHQDSMGAAIGVYDVKFYLLLKTDLKMKTFIHNYVFGTDDKPVMPINAIAAIVDQNPYITKCIIDKPDNTTAYTDMVIEPAELKDAIKNIQYKYGIYLKSLELFFDNGILYILNKLNLNHSYQKGENTVTSVKLNLKTDNYTDDDSVYINDNKGTVTYFRQGSLKKEDYESVLGVLSGNKFVFSNFGSIINSMFGKEGETEFISPLSEIERPRYSRVDVGTRKILDYDMLNNPYNMSSYVYEESKGVPISFLLKNVNPDHFTPNKIVKMDFDTQEDIKLHAGLYNIETAVFIYMSSNNKTKRYNAFSSVVLQLCNKQEGYDFDYTPEFRI